MLAHAWWARGLLRILLWWYILPVVWSGAKHSLWSFALSGPSVENRAFLTDIQIETLYWSVLLVYESSGNGNKLYFKTKWDLKENVSFIFWFNCFVMSGKPSSILMWEVKNLFFFIILRIRHIWYQNWSEIIKIMKIHQFIFKITARTWFSNIFKKYTKTAGNNGLWHYNFSNFPCWRMVRSTFCEFCLRGAFGQSGHFLTWHRILTLILLTDKVHSIRS